jgi:hypothetical protein
MWCAPETLSTTPTTTVAAAAAAAAAASMPNSSGDKREINQEESAIDNGGTRTKAPASFVMPKTTGIKSVVWLGHVLSSLLWASTLEAAVLWSLVSLVRFHTYPVCAYMTLVSEEVVWWFRTMMIYRVGSKFSSFASILVLSSRDWAHKLNILQIW